MMTRKDYQAIADQLREQMQDERDRANGRKAVRNMAVRLANVFAPENVRFDSARFYLAVGLTSEGDLPEWATEREDADVS